MPQMSVSVSDEVYDLVRATQEHNAHLGRSAIISLLIRNGFARMAELKEREGVEHD